MYRFLIVFLTLSIAGVTLAADVNLSNQRTEVIKDSSHVDGVLLPTVREGGEDIGTAVPVPGLPFNDTGETCDNIDDYEEVCPFASTSPDVVYSYSPAADGFIDIDLCGSLYDTKLFVYENGHTPGAPYACNDDFYNDDVCGSFVSALFGMPVTGGNTYYIVIDGYGGDCGEYLLSIDDAGPPCFVICDSDDALPEGEPPLVSGYLDEYNGGCNSPEYGNPFQLIDWGTEDGLGTMCGVSGWFDNGARDTDWFIAKFGDSGEITVTLESQYPCYLFELGPQDCAAVDVLQQPVASCGLPATMTVVGAPGDYTWLFVGPTVYVSPDDTTEFPYILTLSGHDVFVVSTEELSWGGVKALYR